MGRVIPAFAQFLDGQGDPLAYGWLRFLAPNSTNTNKNTYNDPLYQIPNANPLQLDAEGRCPSVFGVGDYRIVSYTNDPDEEDSPGEQIQMFDPVTSQGTLESVGGSGAVFDAWSATVTYDLGDIVVRDLDYYRSLINSNLALDPLLETYAWEQIEFLRIYNSTISYTTGDLIYYDENLYLSLADSNLGNNPITSPSWWRAVATGCKGFSHQTTDYTITSTEREYLIVLTSAATADATFDLPAMSANTDKFCLWIYNQSDYVLTVDAVGSAGVWLNSSGTLELTGGSLIQLGYNSYLNCWLPIGGSVGPTLGNQILGTSTYPVLNMYSADITTTNINVSGLATIQSLNIPSDESLYLGDSNEFGISYDSTATNLNFNFGATTYWAIESGGSLIPGSSNPVPNIGTASDSVNFIYTNNISLPDGGYALFGDGDDLGIYCTGALSAMASIVPLTIGTIADVVVTFIQNNTAVCGLNASAEFEVAQTLRMSSATPIFYMGTPTELVIQRTGAASATYINALNYAVIFQSGSSNVFGYDSTLDVDFYNNAHFLDNMAVYFGTDDDGGIYYYPSSTRMTYNVASGNRHVFAFASVPYYYISSSAIYPAASYNLGANGYEWNRVYTNNIVGSGTTLGFGVSSGSLRTITSIYEEEYDTGLWRIVFEITGDSSTYYIAGYETLL